MGLIGLVINVSESLHLFEGLFIMAETISEALGIPPAHHEESDHERIERRVLIFDFVHVSLFFLSIFYVLVVSLTFVLVRATWKRWTEYELGTNEAVIRRTHVLRERIKKHNKLLLPLNWILLYKYYSNNRRLNYFSIRHRFLRLHKLDASFRYVFEKC